ncbi:hypothetical protein [Roseococcus pinisoli]|uniref:Uncharacterized protein n=1 Tax=Roseococcus pinisoli TaxID=2835040 RepID=A0ABS5QG90_9PROT|nr:hypothetical protein [Roseococcus pinisoli]MBS7812393.1 hypothetical protein [Roseococcus pinisoli]
MRTIRQGGVAIGYDVQFDDLPEAIRTALLARKPTDLVRGTDPRDFPRDEEHARQCSYWIALDLERTHVFSIIENGASYLKLVAGRRSVAA